MSLIPYGLSPSVEHAFRNLAQPGARLGRVVLSLRERILVRHATGEVSARPPNRPALGSGDPATLPVVGDWLALLPPDAGSSATASKVDPEAEWRILAVLPRRSKLSRKVAGARSAQQVVAANIDFIFIVMGLDGDFNLRRMERFAAMAWASGAQPVAVLTKADRNDQRSARRSAVAAVVPGVPVHAISSLERSGLEALDEYLEPASTIALIGSSGVGKSTLINTLAGREVLATGDVRARDDRGRHTTSHRQLILLPNGAMVVDGPGVREIQLWADDSAAEGLDRAFEDIERLSRDCRYRDCRHQSEPGCAVLAAMAAGELDSARLDSWRNLERELRYQARRLDSAARRADERRLSAHYRAFQQAKKRRRDPW